MSMGKIVIASKIAGIPEQIEDGLDGLLVEPSDEVMLAEKIELIMNNSKLSDQLAQRAKDKFSKQFSSEIAVKKYLDLYNLLISGTVY
jgi:glycosyltransferase involved in cell wall biosynthesis